MNKQKILLALLPYWTPLIPPQGIARIKGFLKGHGYNVRTVDVNLEEEFKQLYDAYFDLLKKYVPQHNQANIYNIGNDAWREHMMAHINYTDEAGYVELVRIIIEKIFYHTLEDEQIKELNNILSRLYRRLETYFLDLLERENPGVLGLSVYRDTLAASLFVFRLAKRVRPDILTVMGGSVFSIQLNVGSPNMDAFLEETRECIDKIIVGGGEILLLKLLRGELPESQRLFTKEDIDGETLGFTSVDMFDFSDFKPEAYPYMAVQGSASCPNQCSFCNVASFYGKYRQRDPRDVVDDMIKLHERYGCRLFNMLDALLNDVGPGIAEEIIRRGVSLYWDGYFRVSEHITGELALHLRRGGFYRARMGVESGSQRVLDLMGKEITVGQTRATISNLANAGIKTTAYIVVGHPGETEADFQQTLDLIEDLKNDLWEVECNPFFYIYSGQGSAGEWTDKRMLLYPPWAKDMLICQTWIVDTYPPREEMFSRVYRFVEHCKRLGVSTPWSISGVNNSDLRWKRLHSNAVPAVLELLKKHKSMDDLKHIQELVPAVNLAEDEGGFDF